MISGNLDQKSPHLSLVHVEEPNAQNDAGELLLYSLLTSSFEFWTWAKDGMKDVDTTSTRWKIVAYLCVFIGICYDCGSVKRYIERDMSRSSFHLNNIDHIDQINYPFQ